MSNAREAAFEALQAWRVKGAWSDIHLRGALSALPIRERGLATHLVYGVITNRISLDAYIRLASSIGLSRIEPQVLDILRLGVYQLHYLTKIPKSAAVDESVKLARKYAPKRVLSFVNAVLRKVAAWETLPPLPELWQQVSHPKWLVEALIAQEGYARAKALLQFNNEIPKLCIQVAPDKLTLLTEAFLSAGIEFAPHPLMADCLLLAHTGDVEALPKFHDGWFLVADAAARMAVMAAAPTAGERVLDACAAPGGKSVLMRWANDIQLTSCDVHEHKISKLQETLAKYGLDGVSCVVGDASLRQSAFIGAFDLVLADVPCSGLGIIRKKPDIRYKSMQDIAALPAIQLQILRNLATYVRPGGRLVYVTCTVLHAENEDVITQFLADNSDFTRESFALPIGTADNGQFAVWSPRDNMDGFFMARLRRNI